MTRGWAGGTPSPLLALLLRHSTASSLVLLDEVDKIGEGLGKAHPLAAMLLGLLEPETARRWYDTFLQTTSDLSRLVFVGTANGLTGLSRPLLSRFTMVHVPEPGLQHQAGLVRGITHELADTWGLPREVLPAPPEVVYAHNGRNAPELRRCAALPLRLGPGASGGGEDALRAGVPCACFPPSPPSMRLTASRAHPIVSSHIPPGRLGCDLPRTTWKTCSIAPRR